MSTEPGSDPSPAAPEGARILFGLTLIGGAMLVSGINAYLALRPDTPQVPGLLGLVLAVVTVLVAGRSAATANRLLLAVTLGLLVVQSVVMLWAVPPGPWPDHRMLRVISLFLALAVVATAILVYSRIARPALALTAVGAVTILLTFAEAASGLLLRAPDPEVVFEEQAGRSPAPARQDTVVFEYFEDDPDGYLDVVDNRSGTWSLKRQPGQEAALVLPPEQPASLKVEITRSDSADGWHLQLVQAGIRVEAGQGYTLQFRYRAEHSRPISAGFLQAHPPWEMIGFYRQLRATTDWQAFAQQFTVAETDDNTRIVFDLAGDTGDVEFADIALTDDLGLPVEPPRNGPRYHIKYRYNAAGCRDDDASDSNPGAAPVLVVGSTSTFGRDLHERHTFAAQLERPDSALRAAVPAIGSGIGEVINCGRRGAELATIAESLPELLAEYHPRQVVLAIARDDLRRIRESGMLARLGTAPAACRVLTLCARMMIEEPTQSPEVLAEVAQVVARMRNIAHEHGATLRVALIQTDSDPGWDALRETLDAAFGRGDSTVISVAPALIDSLPVEELQMPGRDLPSALAHRLTAAHLAPLLVGSASRAVEPVPPTGQ